jgi:methylphosphotriester-DNA--protein-cysteine methyltransferase
MKPLLRLFFGLVFLLAVLSGAVVQQPHRSSLDRTNLAPVAVQPQQVGYQDDITSVYYASKKSDVFHRATCRYVAQIHPDNLISFKSRADAISSGRRPCKVCKP